MKRSIATLVGLAITASLFAQGAFTIRRPTNGSLVRETVKLRIPRASISEGSYVGIWVNGQFLEAVVPGFGDKVEDGLWIYELDTKERGLADGNLKIEAVLYAPFGDSTRVVNRSSVNVRLDNRSSLKAPAGGFKMRYNFVPGQEMIYSVQMRVGRSTISEAQAKLGGRAAELGAELFTFRYLVGFDQRLNNGTRGLVRFQAHPQNGKDHVMVMLSGDDAVKRYERDTLHPIYMMMSNTGREIFGRAPFYTGLDETSGRTSTVDLFATFPLPILPERGVTVGSTWSSSFAAGGAVPIEEIYGAARLTQGSPARGTIEAIEYQNGERTVKVRNKIGVSGPGGNVGFEQDEVYWFSLDRGIILRMERNYVTQTRIRVQPSGGGAAGGPAGGGAPGTPGGGKPGRTGSPGGGGGSSAGMGQTGPGAPTVPTGMMQGKAGGGGRTSDPNAGSRPGMGSGAGRSGGGSYRIVRERLQQIFTLDAVTK